MKDRIELNGVMYVKEETTKRGAISKWFIREGAGGGVDVIEAANEAAHFMLAGAPEFTKVSQEEADYVTNKPTEGDWEFRVPKKGDTLLSHGNMMEMIASYKYRSAGFLSGRRWVKVEPKEITFEEIYNEFNKYFMHTSPDSRSVPVGGFLDRAQKQIEKAEANAKG